MLTGHSLRALPNLAPVDLFLPPRFLRIVLGALADDSGSALRGPDDLPDLLRGGAREPPPLLFLSEALDFISEPARPLLFLSEALDLFRHSPQVGEDLVTIVAAPGGREIVALDAVAVHLRASSC